MGKRIVNVTQPSHVKRDADDNVAKVMGKGAYWLVKSVVFIPVTVVKGADKVIKIVTGKDE
jgi:hypothetical protein